MSSSSNPIKRVNMNASGNLAAVHHTLRLVKTRGGFMDVGAFRVFQPTGE